MKVLLLTLLAAVGWVVLGWAQTGKPTSVTEMAFAG